MKYDCFRMVDQQIYDPILTDLMDKAAKEIRSSYEAAVNKWLEHCVEVWCPEAHSLAKDGLYQDAQRVLVESGFRLSEEAVETDRLLTFWKGETPVMRCRIKIPLLNPKQ